ncbi:unnamed protein product, partial [marine sediment metagenome]
ASKNSISLLEKILKSIFKRKYIIRNDSKPKAFKFLKNNKLRFWRIFIRISLNNSSSKITAKNKEIKNIKYWKNILLIFILTFPILMLNTSIIKNTMNFEIINPIIAPIIP